MSADPRLGVVVLTQGNRPEELGRLLDSVALQDGPEIPVVVVGNGAALPALPGAVTAVELAENVGIPAGRNIGMAKLDVDVVLFLDDDGWLGDPQVGTRLRALFGGDDRLGVVSFRIVDPETGASQRRHVPRLRVGDPLRSSAVTTFLGGACAVRRALLDQVGGLPAEFFYSHEETDLAWRALDAGWSLRYCAELVLYHPATSPSRHPGYFRLGARNRVWLARRNLPWPLVPVYLGVWTAITVLRIRDPRALRAWLGGFVAGWKAPCGARRPISWRTVWRMSRLGRPPVV
jgi:GT2 family glycosyltransferase